jgi:hypothetical protein
VPGPADSLQPAGHRRRRLDLDHEVDRAHVDAQLEAAGGDDGGQPAGLEVVLDERPLLLADRTVVGARDGGGAAVGAAGLRHERRGRRVVGGRLLLGRALLVALGRDLVQPGRQPLGQPPRVGEHDGRLVLLDEVDDPRLDVRPDGGRAAVAVLVEPDRGRHRGSDNVELVEVGHRDDDAEIPLLLAGRGDDLDRPAAAEEPGHLFDGPDRRRQPDALRRLLEQRVEPFERQGQVGAALAAGDRVHLVDDDGLDVPQRLARLRREQQEQRLGRGDEDVGRVPGEPPSLVGGGVAGADADRDVGRGQAEAGGGVPDAGQRRAQVPLDVDGERLERGDVEDPAAVGGVVGHRLRGQPVERPEERRQRLARPRGSHDQGVVGRGDRTPGALLCRRGRGERPGEPRTRGRAEQFEDVCHPPIIARPTDKVGAFAVRHRLAPCG